MGIKIGEVIEVGKKIKIKLFYDLPFSLISIRIADYLLILAAVLSIISGVKYYIMSKEYLTDK